MNWLWYCIEISVNLIEVGLFLYLINSKFPGKYESPIPSLLVLFFCTTGVSCIGLLHIDLISEVIFEPVVMFLYLLLMRKGKTWLQLFWTVLGIALISAANYAGIALGLLMPGITMDIILHQHSITRIQLLIFCKITQTVVFFLLIKRRSFENLGKRTIILLIFVPIVSIVTVALQIEYGLGPALTVISQFLLAGASMSILIINIVVFILYEGLSQQAENNLKMQVTLQQYDMLMHHYEEIREIYNKLRDWRHDYHNHLQVIYGYLQLEKYESLNNYLKEIEKSVTDMDASVNSGNLLIDAIVSSKFLIAKSQNIQVSADVHVPPNLKISDTDMCILFGNLLDNAIEANQRIIGAETRRFIEIEVKTIKGYLQIVVRNSTNGIVRRSGANFISLKKEKFHGIGMEHIDKITGKYEGYVSREHENCVFETNIILPLELVYKPSLQTTKTV